MIKFKCPHCKATASASSDFAGKVVPCNQCGNHIRIPLLKAILVEEEPPKPRLTSADRLARWLITLVIGVAICIGLAIAAGVAIVFLLPEPDDLTKVVRRYGQPDEVIALKNAPYPYLATKALVYKAERVALTFGQQQDDGKWELLAIRDSSTYQSLEAAALKQRMAARLK